MQKYFTHAPVTVTTAGTRKRLRNTSLPATDIVIMADPGNSDPIYVGDDTVTAANGIPLAAGETYVISTPAIRGNQEDFDLADVYLDADANGMIARVSYVSRR